MDLYDVVALKVDIPEYRLTKGQKGTILLIYNENDFEIEFCDDEGITLYLGTICKDKLELVWSYSNKSYIKNK